MRTPRRSLGLVVAGAWLAAALGVACEPHGAHDALDGGPERCATCHMTEYAAVTRPPHAGGRPPTCAVCHGEDQWSPAVLHHPAFALTGAHLRASCFFCHRGTPPDFVGVSRECIGCHREDYDGSTFPGHSSFATTCADCHSTATWKSATPPPAADGGVDVVGHASHGGEGEEPPPPQPPPPPAPPPPPRRHHHRGVDTITHASRRE